MTSVQLNKLFWLKYGVISHEHSWCTAPNPFLFLLPSHLEQGKIYLHSGKLAGGAIKENVAKKAEKEINFLLPFEKV